MAHLLLGETGRLELALFVCRDASDSAFFRQELPGLVHALERGIEQSGRRLIYPWAREAPLTGVGYAVGPVVRGNDDPIFDWLKAHPQPGQDLFKGYKSRRVLPKHPNLPNPIEPGLVTWG